MRKTIFRLKADTWQVYGTEKGWFDALQHFKAKFGSHIKNWDIEYQRHDGKWQSLL